MCELFSATEISAHLKSIKEMINMAKHQPKLFNPDILQRLELVKGVFQGDIKSCMRYLEKYYPKEFGLDD